MKTIVSSDCSEALTWAKSKGISVNSIDGVRYIYGGTEKSCIRLKDDVASGQSEKQTAQFNIDYTGFYSAQNSSLKAFTPLNQYYTVKKVVFYGYSKYGSEKLGSRLTLK